MKITISKTQWETMGKQAGWMKQASPSDFNHRDPKNYAPGQTPYTDEEWSKVRKMVGDAANAEGTISIEELDKEPELKDDMTYKRRHIKVTMSDGDVINTEINGTKKEIMDYYLPNGKGIDQDYDMHNPNKVRHPVKVEFIG